ncbi:ABC transporter permease [Thermoproteus tenax]|uniref:Oligopeptide ABC transporter, permease protein n=1 Tax=Thermoproteus tenax (strain ATCC 35583 / DSM 2078 / JCM 9277 / NBRC 100435 / Kra 1) TaxID=768679 RepID=G4RMK2_THETK|nr:ABC transporter permease [Thermoproteus tenax]CCC80833.1 oligopeptide ABC transporter, permease protein [Thermoproteus tenax Kra 1]
MGLLRSLALRAVNLAIILFVVLFAISYVLSGPAAQLLKSQIELEARALVSQLAKSGHYTPAQIQELYNTLVDELSRSYGLNQPTFIRVFYIIYNMMTFNWGYSYFPDIYGIASGKVSDIIASALPGTILLDTFGILLSAFIGIQIGLRSALKYGSRSDRAVMYYGAVSNGLPQWWVGVLLLLVFSFYLESLKSPIYFPAGGILSPQYYSLWFTNPGAVFVNPKTLADLLWHFVLPLATVLIVNIGGWAYFARTVTLNVAQEDFVTFAKVRGLPEGRVTSRYILRPAAPAILTSIMLSLPFIIFGGFIITEAVFRWWGLGYVYNLAIFAPTPDLPVIVALTYASTLLYIVLVLVLEVLYIVLDPRIRSE